MFLCFSLSSSADSLLQNSIAHAGKAPVIDAAAVPDRIYGETVKMYINKTLLDDVPLEDLSDFSGSFYSVWKDGKLYFHFTLKNFSDEDEFALYFDLEDSNADTYGVKTPSVLFEIEDGDICASFEGESDVDPAVFIEKITAELSVSGNVSVIEASLDFSELYSGFSFSSGKRVGFEIAVCDKIDGGIVRYVWNDDTGEFFRTPDNLGTFIMGTASVTEPDDVENVEKDDDDNPGTSDNGLFMYMCVCFGTLIFGTVISCRMKV